MYIVYMNMGNQRRKTMTSAEEFKAEVAELYRVALTWTDDKKRARRMVEAYLAGQNRMMPAFTS